MEVVVFPNIYERNATLFTGEKNLVITGKISIKEEELPKLLCEVVMDSSKIVADVQLVKLYIKFSSQEDVAIQSVLELLSKNQGNAVVYFYYADTKKTLNLKGRGVCVTNELLNELKKHIPEDNIVTK